MFNDYLYTVANAAGLDHTEAHRAVLSMAAQASGSVHVMRPHSTETPSQSCASIHTPILGASSRTNDCLYSSLSRPALKKHISRWTFTGGLLQGKQTVDSYYMYCTGEEELLVNYLGLVTRRSLSPFQASDLQKCPLGAQPSTPPPWGYLLELVCAFSMRVIRICPRSGGRAHDVNDRDVVFFMTL